MQLLVGVDGLGCIKQRLMLYSAHQLIPAKGKLAETFGGTYEGKRYEESGAKPWELTDQQKEFVQKDKVRHVLRCV